MTPQQWMGLLVSVGTLLTILAALAIFDKSMTRKLKRQQLAELNQLAAQMSVEELAECVVDRRLELWVVKSHIREAKAAQQRLEAAVVAKKLLKPPRHFYDYSILGLIPDPHIAFAVHLAKAEKALEVVGRGKLREGPIIREGCRAYVGELVCSDPHNGRWRPTAPLPTTIPPVGQIRRT